MRMITLLLITAKILFGTCVEIFDGMEDFSKNNNMLPFNHDIDFVRTMPELLRSEYQRQSPFPHIDIHDFFDESLIKKAANEFTDFTNATVDVLIISISVILRNSNPLYRI